MNKHGTLIGAALDWSVQKADFAADGSLRGIYVQTATLEDWRIVVAQILDGDYNASLGYGGVAAAVPANFEALFDRTEAAYLMGFTVGTVGVSCNFFTPNEIEFSFAPNDVMEAARSSLLAFMIDVGNATKKCVIMTPENCPESPIFEYDVSQNQLRWVSLVTGAAEYRQR